MIFVYEQKAKEKKLNLFDFEVISREVKKVNPKENVQANKKVLYEDYFEPKKKNLFLADSSLVDFLIIQGEFNEKINSDLRSIDTLIVVSILTQIPKERLQ